MKLFITAVLSSLAFSVAAQGYVLSPDGEPVRDSSGQCVRTGTWTSADVDPVCNPVIEVATSTYVTTVLFDFDKSNLTAETTAQLTRLATIIPPKTKVTIIGYADPIGDAVYNLLLSEERAAVVADFLDNLIEVELNPLGVGSTHPLQETAKCAAIKNFSQKVACYAPDRRAEISFIK